MRWPKSDLKKPNGSIINIRIIKCYADNFIFDAIEILKKKTAIMVIYITLASCKNEIYLNAISLF